jgi:isoquinoline 1-oxidoreductase beta subunit
VKAVHRISRRDFLRASGVAGSALVLGVHVSCARKLLPGSTAPDSFAPNVFVSIDAGGAVRLTVHRSEMGQGARTVCAMLLAEELEVPWEHIAIEQAPGDERYGNQSTAGSTTVVRHWLPLRRAGAAVREMLRRAASETWGVPADQCLCSDAEVVHGPTGRRLSYGELVPMAATYPVPPDPPLKEAADFKIVGTPRPHLDAHELATGRARFGWDTELPGLLHAVVERSPTVGGSLEGYDAEAARAVPGVVELVELEADASGLTNAGIAVVADNTWAALEGRGRLAARWKPGPLAPENSAEYGAALLELCDAPGRVVREDGDLEAAFEAAERLVEARYTGPYLAHAPMEPPAATARVEDGRCELWAPTQAPQWARHQVAESLGLEPSKVTVHVTFLGGGFGRKSKPDFCVEAARLAQRVGRPVRLVWTREDDLRHGFYRAQNAQFLKAAIRGGRPTALLHRTAFPTIDWEFDPGSLGPNDNELGQGFVNNPYRWEALRCEAGSIASSVRRGWLRSVCNTFHSFALNGFLDELAHAVAKDPIELHLELLGEARTLPFGAEPPHHFDTGRLIGVIRAVAEQSGWGRSLPAGEGLGFAAQHSFRSYVAMVVRASADADGRPRAREVWCAVDCGQVVNPDTMEAQMQGAVALGLSYALHGRITLEAGAVQQGNFDDYPVLSMSEMPRVHVHTIDSTHPPSGIGEPGVPPSAPAFCNALFAATGRRYRDLPVLS